MPIASIDEINSALMRIKSSIYHSSDCFVVRTDLPKNEVTILKLGITTEHVLEEICGLTYRDYHKGPDDNKSEKGPPKGQVWFFGKQVDGLEVYIKIHIVPTKKFTNGICISFHEPEYPMSYPYR